MPIYEYLCSHCEFNFEIKQNYNSNKKRKCPQCGKLTLDRVIFPAHIYSYNDPKTIGLLADRNTKKCGKYELENKIQKSKAQDYRKNGNLPEGAEYIKRSTEKPWWRKDKKKIDFALTKLSPKQKQEYIQTGKKT